MLKRDGLLRGQLTPKEQMQLISGTDNIQQAVEGAIHVQVLLILLHAFKGFDINCRDLRFSREKNPPKPPFTPILNPKI